MLTSYQKGYKRELDFIRKLRESGKFHTILRSAGSRSPFDIVAISKSKILLVQVKSSRKGLKKQIRILKRLKVPSCAKKQLWIHGKGWKSDPGGTAELPFVLIKSTKSFIIFPKHLSPVAETKIGGG